MFGRPLYLNEMREIVQAENIERAYKARESSGNWAEWTKQNPELAAILTKAQHHG